MEIQESFAPQLSFEMSAPAPDVEILTEYFCLLTTGPYEKTIIHDLINDRLERKNHLEHHEKQCHMKILLNNFSFEWSHIMILLHMHCSVTDSTEPHIFLIQGVKSLNHK